MKMEPPFITCICPTYKRPKLLQNVLACFVAQDYPKDRCELIIYDDAAQFNSQEGENWRLTSIEKRYANLPDKFNAMIHSSKGDIIAIWEDDDIFLPWNLKDVSTCFLKHESEYFVSKNVWSTYNQSFGRVQQEEANGRFHSSWRFTRKLFNKVKGYPKTEELSFDQQMGALLKKAAGTVSHYDKENSPSYVYRWGNGYWHGSQKGDGEGYQSLWAYVGNLAVIKQAKLKSEFDDETKAIYKLLGA